jgi:hypothetical protein
MLTLNDEDAKLLTLAADDLVANQTLVNEPPSSRGHHRDRAACQTQRSVILPISPVRRGRLMGLIVTLALLPSVSHGLELETSDIAPDQPIDSAAMVARFSAIAEAVTAAEVALQDHATTLADHTVTLTDHTITLADNASALAELSARITALENGQSGPRVAGDDKENWSTLATAPTDPTALIDDFVVTLATHGQDVRVELGGAGGQPWVGGETGDPFTRMTFRIERQTEGVDVGWVNVEEFYFEVASQDVGDNVVRALLRVPPGSISAVDTPPVGSTTYRVLAWHDTYPGLSLVGVGVSNVQIFAQELGASSA